MTGDLCEGLLLSLTTTLLLSPGNSPVSMVIKTRLGMGKTWLINMEFYLLQLMGSILHRLSLTNIEIS